MLCPRCDNEFTPTTKNGYTPKFCSRRCANSRTFSDDTKKLKSKQNKTFYAGLSEEQRNELFAGRSQIMIDTSERKLKEWDFEKLGSTLRRAKILEEQDNKCGICHINQVWNGMELKFQLDHVSGHRADNSRENLRLICPNCHSQKQHIVSDPKLQMQKSLTNLI